VLMHRLKEWCRLLGAPPSRMRDRGGNAIPPDVRLAGEPALMGAPPWITLARASCAENEGNGNEVA